MPKLDLAAAASPLPEIEPPEGVEVGVWEELAEVHRSTVVWAEGDPHATTVIVLDNPGARVRHGQAWVCPTRETLRAAAKEAGLGAMYVTWLVKFRPRRAYDKPRVRALGREEVLREIEKVSPRVIVALGDVALSTLLRAPNAHVRDLRGQPRSFEERPFIAGYHPLAARRRPNLYPLLVEDLKRAAAVIRQGEPSEARPPRKAPRNLGESRSSDGRERSLRRPPPG